MCFKTLTVMLWIHCLVRKRKYIWTTVQFIFPVLPFLLIFLLRDLLFPQILDDQTFIGVENPEPLSLMRTTDPPCVLYTPDTNFTRTLMGLAARKLNLQPLETLPRKRKARGYYPFNDALSIFRYSQIMGPHEAIVIFHNISADTWPDSLCYSIRMKRPFEDHETDCEEEEFKHEAIYKSSHTHHSGFMRPFFRKNNTLRHRIFSKAKRYAGSGSTGKINKPFMRLQWAVDTSYIQILTNNKVTQKLILQEFPHVKLAKKTVIYTLKAEILFFASGIAILPVFTTLMLHMLVEKQNGVQELTKMMGVTTQTLFLSLLLNEVPTALVYSIGVTVLLKLEPYPVLAKSNSFLLFLALLLQFYFAVFVAIVGCYLTRNAPATLLTVSSTYILLLMPAFIWSGMDISKYMVYPMGLIPFMPISWIFKAACKLEFQGQGLTYSTMMTRHSKSVGPAFVAYIYLIIEIFLCMVLIWYLDRVISGLYGPMYPWNFPFKKSYWLQKAEKTNDKAQLSEKPEIDSLETQDQDPVYFEKPPEHLEAGIQVINVSKDYGKYRVLNNLSLNVYKNEITILLGHNGSGKTTLISIIAGMSPATKGKVLVNGFDPMSEKTIAQQHIGWCPQQNIFFEDITVIEHVMIFYLLSRRTFKEARKLSEDLLKKLHLKDKARSIITDLTEGMRRRVQLACAVAGQASVLLLDEPTFGIDAQSRRELWDLLLTLRGSHTVLLTTHYMEEADALGDRVVVLAAGELRCHATPKYLKRAMGPEYRLTFTTVGLPNEPAITSAVKSVIPEITVKDTDFNSISYNLPSTKTEVFPSLFAMLEAKRSELGIDSIGIGTSTLEEVFLKLCSNIETRPILESDIEKRKAPRYKKLTGVRLCLRQMLTLMKRYLLFIWRNKFSQILLGVVRVILLLILITVVTNDKDEELEEDWEANNWALNLALYKPSIDYRVLLKVNSSDSDLRPMSDQYPWVQFERTSDIDLAALRVGKQAKMEHINILAAIELNDTDAKIQVPMSEQYAAPVALNLISNLIVLKDFPWAGGQTITIYNHPLLSAYTTYLPADVKEPKSIRNMKVWIFSTTLMILSGVIFLVQLPSKEASGARHILMLAGCSPELYWGTTLLTASIQVLLTYVVTIAIVCSLLDNDNTFSDGDFIAAASVVIMLGNMAMLAFSYGITLHFSQTIAVGIIAVTMFLFELIFPILLGLIPDLTSPFKPVALVAMPPYTFNEAMVGCAMTTYLNTLCRLNRDKCPNLAFTVPHFDAEKCCDPNSYNPWHYFSFQEPAPGKKIIYLIVQIFMYMILVILTERGVFALMWEKTMNFAYKGPTYCYYNGVKAEREHVKKAIKLPKHRIPDIMLVYKLHKNYRRYCSSNNAIKGITFSVKKGECFGLLGVNGAGKSNIFQMLTAERHPTRGRVLVNGYELDVPYSTKYLHSLGYCPQDNVMDDFLTGRQQLNLLLSLNGLNARDARIETGNWIKFFDLEKYTDQLLSSYSEGCLRRMATASALCTDAPVTLLDEPTAGMDVAARRRVWFALKRGLRNQHAIIINSYCFDEVEVLCHRICILVNGKICALGSSAGLRAAHAWGHSILLKVYYDPTLDQKMDVLGATNPKMDNLKSAIERKFNCTLQDEHKTMLHYHINETMHYSKLFEEMEDLKTMFSEVIEDYSVSETTLEEVFLSYTDTKESKDASAGPASLS